ncbi:phenylalanine--tRNA ligase subunit alpha [Amygdalobacter nucleatus]|uniref:Phenylalanine--tRNA ligase alpha subunit n=1 Tax=Amygdalobacter nucleatus TaxID=3029274 RepID=A0A133YFP2_9FIRM|nr:phenylalanine--tRNA ligase subunit alpha [Amygdalobacter nucleatus]KXB42008.1 phenylalanine--tRNA ligase, alpha subunit [Amygdalobacter nucleatus]MDF0485665.1 phenylalanine--tRNA ligase subunit alpha [Amygdalobacter nucleatus]WEG36485.1 phenylalanine--tRNA ligase subunit alpha [Amygdalobacter nucleatus]
MEQIDLSKLEVIAAKYFAQAAEVHDTAALETLRLAFFGKNGDIKQLQKGLGSVVAELRPQYGQAINELKTKLESDFVALKDKLEQAAHRAKQASEQIDINLPAKGTELGTLHPITKTIQDMEHIFIGLGYEIAEGPEIEWVKNNFDLLNIPEGHPSREFSDTFYLNDKICLRTQTSPVQIRVMQNRKPPIYIICPGKVYRPDTADATHSPVFHQVEGLVVDKGIRMSDLVGTLKYMAKALFGANTEIRLRPHHFPFTEPSCEVDVTCWKCHGSGCPTCKGEGFVEVLGAGMVHPKVLKNCGIDPDVYSGFAFGIGAERVCMAHYDIADIRYFSENNLRFLAQFK